MGVVCVRWTLSCVGVVCVWAWSVSGGRSSDRQDEEAASQLDAGHGRSQDQVSRVSVCLSSLDSRAYYKTCKYSMSASRCTRLMFKTFVIPAPF